MSLVLATSLLGCTAEEADAPGQPVVAFPSWSTSHDQEQPVVVTAAPGWSIRLVEYSTDGTQWSVATAGTAATATGGMPYSVALKGLDIGSNELTLKVTSTYRGQVQVDYFYSTIDNIAAEFSCAGAAQAMLPTQNMIRNLGTELRTMVGYFGRADGSHTVTFILDFTNLPGNDYQVVGSIVNYGSDSITVSYDVGAATCDTGAGTQNRHDCDTPYSLTVLVDGKPLCPKTAFGNIHTYWNGQGF